MWSRMPRTSMADRFPARWKRCGGSWPITGRRQACGRTGRCRCILRRLRSVSLGAFGTTVGVAVSEPAEAGRPSDRVGVMEQGILAALEDLACPAGHRGLLVLADGLEQLWSADAWSGALVAGLLVAAQYVTLTFRGVDCVVFIRTDIYERVQFPQKNRFRGEEQRISWTTGGLRELIEKRVPCQNSRTVSDLAFSVIVRLLSGTR